MSLMSRVAYMGSGLTGRLQTTAKCPTCGAASGELRDRKWFHSLIECQRCRLLHRYPAETGTAMAAFYDNGYVQDGLTTELPDDEALAALMAKGFKGSGKDFTYHTDILRALGVPPNGRLLDYGANWGYASWQFARAGFDVTSFEISKPRAAFGAKLGLSIKTNIADVGRGFDAVYSCHVLEHTPDPGAVVRQQLGLVNPGGLVAAHTPNGSRPYQAANPAGFHRMWGLVHPVLLTDEFVRELAGSRPFIVTSDDRPEQLATWDGTSQVMQPATAAGLFFAIRA